ncbi:MAG TPA: hypothetical protein VNP92_24810 [Actinophytocola sp.]|nr:hypothetical protein [Actinophytocola sp.]
MILVFAVLIIGIAAALLARTLAAAQSIDKKAQTISGNAGSIDVATDTVVQLNRTNEVAASILSSAKPLEGQLRTVDTVARDIDGLAKSINTSAGTINGTAGRSTALRSRSTTRRATSTPTPGRSTVLRERSTPRRGASTLRHR